MRTPKLRKRRKSTAPATVIYTTEDVPVIYVECARSGIKVGPGQTQTDAAVRKLITKLTHACDCGCRAHRARYAEGTPPANSLLGL